MSTRTTSRSVTEVVPTEAQARTSLAAYIDAHLRVEAIENATKQQIEEIKKKAEDEARPLVDLRSLHETTLMQYADGHPELFQKRQKTELYGGHKIGWQVSPPAVGFVRATGERKKQTVEGFLKAVRSFLDLAVKFIRTKEEIDKDAILLEYRTTEEQCKASGDSAPLLELKTKLATIGVAVVQEERFVIDLNLQPEMAQQAA